ncbi:MAG: HDIG domain-containing protein [Lachnospiraceae bacterium]|nr:HDIG domain-containing protein [Lachnospiraceae bacterium]
MRAIFSKKDIENDNNELIYEFWECVSDLLYQEDVQKLKFYSQHCNTSRFQHSLNVAYYSFLVCRKMGWDYHSAARAGLLHDLFFYDWREEDITGKEHIMNHAKISLSNAEKITSLNNIEKDAIVRHMWPCTLTPPRYKESYVVTMVDKLCATFEACENKFKEAFA